MEDGEVSHALKGDSREEKGKKNTVTPPGENNKKWISISKAISSKQSWGLIKIPRARGSISFIM